MLLQRVKANENFVFLVKSTVQLVSVNTNGGMPGSSNTLLVCHAMTPLIKRQNQLQSTSSAIASGE